MTTIYRCMCRASDSQGERVRLSLRWLMTKWRELRLTSPNLAGFLIGFVA
jgi:hypothetical protein